MEQKVLRGGNKTLNISKPQVMGILNITPDSFSTVGRHSTLDAALRHSISLAESGAAIIDVGGEATNSNLQNPQVSLQEEIDRVVPLVRALVKEVNIPISVDTSKPEVMKAVVEAGAFMINDVRALRMEGALQTAAKLNVPVCLMHMKYPFGLPENVQQPINNIADSIVEIKKFLEERITVCESAGINPKNIVIDPGFGGGHFGKSPQENLYLLHSLEMFHSLGFPLLVGTSRKTFLEKFNHNPEQERFYSSLSAAVIAAMKGANIIRVHDVKETVAALAVVKNMMGENTP